MIDWILCSSSLFVRNWILWSDFYLYFLHGVFKVNLFLFVILDLLNLINQTIKSPVIFEWLALLFDLFFKTSYGGLVVFVSAADLITLCQSHDVSCLMVLEPADVTATPHLKRLLTLILTELHFWLKQHGSDIKVTEWGL